MACKNLSLLVWFGDFTAHHDSAGYPNIRIRYDPLLSSITQYILHITHYLYIHYISMFNYPYIYIYISYNPLLTELTKNMDNITYDIYIYIWIAQG